MKSKTMSIALTILLFASLLIIFHNVKKKTHCKMKVKTGMQQKRLSHPVMFVETGTKAMALQKLSTGLNFNTITKSEIYITLPSDTSSTIIHHLVIKQELKSFLKNFLLVKASPFTSNLMIQKSLSLSDRTNRLQTWPVLCLANCLNHFHLSWRGS